MSNNKNNQSGAVSLFVVIFSALLITVVTVSFMRIMVGNQKQATDTDLSQSAYDSALAGVEDGKRSVLRYLEACSDPSATTCKEPIKSSLTGANCTDAVSGLVGINISSGAEVKLQTSSNDADLDQAYTCVKINVNTPDYLGVLKKDASKLILLSAVGSFNKIRLSWFNAKDISSPATSAVIPSFSLDNVLLDQANWGNRPSIMRTQLIQYNSNGFSLSEFSDDSIGKSNASTLFLYPTNISIANYDFPDFGRRNSSVDFKDVMCKSDFSLAGFACSVELTMPDPINGDESNRKAYLHLTPLYNGSNFKVELLDGVKVVDFKQVQPEIDSTGRANDLFRRVKSRVEPIDSGFPYPQAAVDIKGDLCKNFAVNNLAYYKTGICEP